MPPMNGAAMGWRTCAITAMRSGLGGAGSRTRFEPRRAVVVPATALRLRSGGVSRLRYVERTAADFTREANYAVVAPIFSEKFGRLPLPPTDPDALINDLIFARMIAPDWSELEGIMVDKI